MKNLSIGIAVSVVLSAVSTAQAEPSTYRGIAGMDSAESRAKVLLTAMEQFSRSNRIGEAYDAITAAHRLAPTTRTACVAGAIAQQLQRFTESTEYFTDCIRRAVESDFKHRDPVMWKTIQGDYETARSRVGALRVHAPPLTHIYIGGKDKGFVDPEREIFVEPDAAHTIVGIGIAATMNTSVTLSRGESRDVFLIPEAPQTPIKTDDSAKPQALSPVPIRPAYEPLALRADIEASAAGMYVSTGIFAASFLATTIFTTAAAVKHADASADFAKVGPDGEDQCKFDPPFKNNDRCISGIERRSTAEFFTSMAIGFGALALGSGAAAITFYYVKSNQQAAYDSSRARATPSFVGASIRSTW